MAIGTDRKLDFISAGFKQLTVIGLFVAFDDIRIDLELQHLVLIRVTLRTERDHTLRCELLLGLLDINLAVAIGTGRRFHDALGACAAMNRLLVLPVFLGVTIDTLCPAMLDLIVVQSRQIPMVGMTLRAVGLGTVGVKHHQLAVRQIFLGVSFARVADIALVGNSALLENRLIDRGHISLVAGVTRGTRNRPGINSWCPMKTLFVTGMTVVAHIRYHCRSDT